MNDQPHIGEAADLFAELADAMHSVQMPGDVVEQYVLAAAKRLSMDVQLMLTQSYVSVQVEGGGRQRLELRRIAFDPHWRLSQTSDLMALADRIGTPGHGISDSRHELKTLLAKKPKYAFWMVWMGYAVYGAAVAARVGGAWREMAAALAIGFVAGAIHFGARRQRVDLVQSFLAGLGGGLVAMLFARLMPGLDMPRALFGGVVLLVPAMVITIGTHELANDALESGVVRLAYGLLRFLMLGFGVSAAARIWQLVAELPAQVESTPLPTPLVMLVLVVGGAGLVVCLQGRRRDALWIIGAVLLAYGAQALTKVFIKDGSPLAASFILGAGAYLYARVPGHQVWTIVVPGLLQLAPGFLGVKSILALLEGRAGGPDTFFGVGLLALQLVIGLLLASALFQSRRLPRLA